LEEFHVFYRIYNLCRKAEYSLRISVAIDGPAGAGKSTIAKLLAKRLNLMYINTGAMYRSLTLAALEKNVSADDIEALCELLESMDMYFNKDRLFINGIDVSDRINMPDVSKNVSKYAAISEVRHRLVKVQRDMSSQYNVIMDGRDIGTVVLKDAAFKFFLTASPERRAQRRYTELISKGISVVYEDILKEIIKRDYEDSHREVDPLVKADDALEVDTTDMTIKDVVDYMFNYIVKNMSDL
jgi:CMP/dCMP kinase